jgi:cytochrome c biogenesis factor
MKKQIRNFLVRLIKRSNKTKKVNDNIPDEILMLYGKFYFYSVCYVVIFGLLYPLLFIGNISNISLVLSFVIFIGLYAYMIYDVLKKSKGFKSAVFSLFVVLVILAISFSIVKIFI